jgi:predicted carbohydrate-binding protein with CBM5 and CBM33 domain
MTRRRMTLIGATLAGVPVLLSMVVAGIASAHGSMAMPPSRIYACFLEGPETPDSAACQAAIALGGTQPVYDWNEVNLPNAAGRHRELIPDGELCSAGRDKYRGFDLARADWSATALPAGEQFTFRYRATAPHRGTFELYLTRDGYQPTEPLGWDDLEPSPFLTATDPTLADGAYVMTGQLPAGKTGRHLVYSIWQRSDSPEAFYTCSDVTFGGGADPSPTASPPPTASPTASPTPGPSSPPPGEPSAWQPFVAYLAGDRVSYGGQLYQCRQSHTSLPGWEPPAVPALWLPG